MTDPISRIPPERRILIATFLCVAVSIIFTVFVSPPPPERPKESAPVSDVVTGGEQAEILPAETEALPPRKEETEPATETASASPEATSSNPLTQVGEVPSPEEIVVDTPWTRFVFSTEGASLRSARLKNYAEIDPPVKLLEAERDGALAVEMKAFWQQRIDEVLAREKLRGGKEFKKGDPIPETSWVELVPPYLDEHDHPFLIRFNPLDSDKGWVYTPSTPNLSVVPGETAELVFRVPTASGVTVVKRFVFSGDELAFNVSVAMEGEGLEAFRARAQGTFTLEWPDGLGHFPFNIHGAQEVNQLRALLNDSMQSPTLRDGMRKEGLRAGQAAEYRQGLEGRVGWVSIETRYFISALIPESQNVQGVYLAQGLMARPPVDTRIGVGLISPIIETPQVFTVYAGPKLTQPLMALGGGLERVVYDSWFGVICQFVEWLLGLFYSIFPSYGVAIILLCIVSKIVLYPLTYKQAQMQRKMGELQPKIAELKEKYKDNAQKMNQEQMKLWKKHGVNPASGCLPMLAQLPIFIALYRMIQSSIDLRGAPFLWIPDLSLPDMTFFLPMSLPYLGNAINILPMIMTAVSMWQMHEQKKMMPDPSQAQIMMFMTAFFFFILYHFSSGLVLYWLTNSLTQMIQQKIMEHLGHSAKPAGAAGALALKPPGGADSDSDEEDDEENQESKAPTSYEARKKSGRPGKRK